MNSYYPTYWKKVLLFLFCSWALEETRSQNLVPNPNFDIFVRCPADRGEIDLAQPWYSPNKKTTDFSHTCAGSGFAGIPINHWGSENPYSGRGYAGIRTWINGDFTQQTGIYREYLAVELTQALQPDLLYRVSFWVSAGDSAKFVSDDLGLYFSQDSIPDLDLLPYTPHVANPQGNYIRRTVGWTKISGQYKAQGGEKHLVIGNFLDNAETTVELRNTNVGFESTYIYIDEVKVEPCDPMLPKNFILAQDSLLCPTEELVLRLPSFPQADYLWEDGNTDSIRIVTAPGLYSASLSLNGCTWEDSIQIGTASRPEFDLGNDTSICPGTSIWIGLEDTVEQFRWGDLYPTLRRQVDQTGSYTLEIFEGSCGFTDSIQIKVLELYDPSLPRDTLICLASEAILKASFDDAQYLWSDLSTNQELTTTQGGRYWVDIENGCFQTREYFNVDTELCGCESFVPNVFSPNGDGIQDLFRPEFREGIGEYSLEIFDRYGRRVFQSDQPNQFWAGTYEGKQVATGVYYWVIQYRCFTNNQFQQEVKKGHVSLLR